MHRDQSMRRFPRIHLGWSVLCASMALSLACSDGIAQKSGASKQKALVLRQAAAVSGETIVYITASALRIDNPGIHSVVIAQAPDWRVLTYNTDSKIYFETTPEKFEGRFNRALAAVYGPIVTVKGWKKINDYSENGMPA